MASTPCLILLCTLRILDKRPTQDLSSLSTHSPRLPSSLTTPSSRVVERRLGLRLGGNAQYAFYRLAPLMYRTVSYGPVCVSKAPSDCPAGLCNMGQRLELIGSLLGVEGERKLELEMWKWSSHLLQRRGDAKA